MRRVYIYCLKSDLNYAFLFAASMVTNGNKSNMCRSDTFTSSLRVVLFVKASIQYPANEMPCRLYLLASNVFRTPSTLSSIIM
jgi:hypothetical protein